MRRLTRIAAAYAEYRDADDEVMIAAMRDLCRGVSRSPEYEAAIRRLHAAYDRLPRVLQMTLARNT